MQAKKPSTAGVCAPDSGKKIPGLCWVDDDSAVHGLRCTVRSPLHLLQRIAVEVVQLDRVLQKLWKTARLRATVEGAAGRPSRVRDRARSACRRTGGCRSVRCWPNLTLHQHGADQHRRRGARRCDSSPKTY